MSLDHMKRSHFFRKNDERLVLLLLAKLFVERACTL